MLKRTLFSLFAFAIAALGAGPVIGTVSVAPTFAPANTPTQVKITALITDPSLSANGVNLQRLNSAGSATAVLGILHDDGINGDAVAGDHIYTLVFTLNEPTPGRIFFRTTAAFQGVLQRVSSSSVAVDIANVASPLSIDAATAPAANAAGWNKSDVTVTFSCAGGAGGSDSCPGIVQVTSEGKAQATLGSASDGSGNNATKSVAINLDKTAPILNITAPTNGAVVSTPSVTLTGVVTDALSGVATFTCNGQSASINGSAFSCNLPLVPGTNAITVQATDVAGNTTASTRDVVYSISTLKILASLSPVPNVAGWNNTDVTVTFSCSGGTSPVICPPSVVISNEGGNQVISRTATDAAGSTATASVSLKIDKTPPTLTISSPAPAATVTAPQTTVTGTVADTLSGVGKVTCNGVTAVLNGQSFSCSLTLIAGPNTIAVQAVDVAGNNATSNLSVTLGAALTISATSTPAPNAAGWNDSSVTVTFTCAGGVGTVTCPQPVAISAEGANQVISRTATDSAGVTATASVTLKIDKTQPQVAISSPVSGGTVTSPQLTITGTATDALSGIAAATCNGSPATLSQSNLSCSLTLTAGLNTIIVQATDLAGNSAAISVPVTFSAPKLTISASPSPAPNAAGWNNANVTVTFTCSGGTGTVTCPQPVGVSTEGANQTISRTATDSVGDSATASVALKIDKTAPTVAISSPLPGATVTTPAITVTGTVTDALSGIASATCNGSPATLTQSALSCTVTLAAGPNTIAVQATDVAGNTTTSSVSVTFSPVTLTISASPSPAPNAAGWNNSGVTVTFTCAGGTAPITCPQPVVVSTEGANQVVSRTATDSAGHSATASVTLKIDKTAPTVAIGSPLPGATVTTSTITVKGTVTDALSGIASATCNGSPATLTQSALSCSVTLAAGPNTIAVQATDIGGNTTTSSVSVTFSPVTLTISAAPSPAPNAAGWNKSDVTVTFTCAGGAAPVTCPQPVVVSSEGANQVVSRTATDSAGHSATASVTLKIDKTPPVTTITSPASGATVTTPAITVTGTVTDALSGIANVTCNGAPATLAQSGLSCNVSLVAGPNTIVVQATDVAGNSTTTSIPITFTATALGITAAVTPPPNSAGWNNSNVTVTFACAGGTAPLVCPPSVVVSAETASQIVSGTVTDGAAKTATASVTIKLDKTPPSFGTLSPANGSTVTAASQTVAGTLIEALSGIASISCNGAPATLTPPTFTCAVSLSSGSNSIILNATDIAGNTGASTLTLTYAPIPTVRLTAPANLSYLNISPTTVSGTVSDPQATVVINSIAVPVANGVFTASIPLAEGPNILTATATSAAGSAGSASITVTLDTTPPHVTITSPADQFVTTSSSISVAGNVNDTVVGTVNSQQAQVTVNSIASQVANRTFLATNVPLNMGANTIQAVAVDQAGNAATTQITVTRQAPQPGQIQLTSGNNQTGIIGTALSAPLVVALTDASGNPAVNKPVIFTVTQNNGMLSVGGGAPTVSAMAMTDALGQATATWTLGMRSGAGSDGVQAYSVGSAGTAVFTATANQSTPGMIVVDSGNNQTGAVNQALPKPLIAVVVDAGHNRLAGIPVTFTVKQGGGNFGGQTAITVITDSDGRAGATLTLALQEGTANNLVTADFAGDTGFPASFTASGLAPGDPGKTEISGLVLDNSNQPIPGVTIRAALTNVLTSNMSAVQAAATVQTDAQGSFIIYKAPVGFVKLLVDGSTATAPGTFPTLDYDMVTVAGQINTVGQSIYLLPIKTNNQLCVTPTTGGGTLTIPEAPGFSLTFAPGQVTFPGGSKTGCVSVTVVHPDKVPMVPGFGQQPRFIVTIQPSGALFNPPAPKRALSENSTEAHF